MKKIIAVMILAGISLTACKKEKKVEQPPVPTNEEELITTFKITFSEENNPSSLITVVFRDLDGPGGNPPQTFDEIHLKTNTVYNAKIELLNESGAVAEDITHEIEEEARDHLFCFTPNNLNVTIDRTDSDGVYGIGLKSMWSTGAASSGTIMISLKHQPGIKNGHCDVGDTDIELNFNTTIAD